MATKPKPEDDTSPEIEAQLAALRAEIAALASTLAALSRSGSDAVKQAATEAYAGLKAQDDFAEAEAQAHAALDGVADYARKKPMQSLGIAAGIGMMLGLLLGRR